jgi:hypothetical protein
MFTIPPTLTPDIPDLKEFAVWLIAIAVVAFGFRHAREIMGFILDKLYQYFVLNGPSV